MKVSVILAHPSPNSFNHAIASVAIETLRRNEHDIRFHDLYDEAFDPLLRASEIPQNASLPVDIQRHCAEITEADGIIIIHPNWWGQPPAILKGWIDKIIRPGMAYEFIEGDEGEGVPNGLLKARTAIVFNTSNTGAERERTDFGDPLETLWKNCIFGLCGVRNFYRRTFSIVVVSSVEQRKKWLAEVRDTVEKRLPKGEA